MYSIDFGIDNYCHLIQLPTFCNKEFRMLYLKQNRNRYTKSGLVLTSNSVNIVSMVLMLTTNNSLSLNYVAKEFFNCFEQLQLLPHFLTNFNSLGTYQKIVLHRSSASFLKCLFSRARAACS